MASFANPFTGNVPRKMSREELVQALRVDIAGELEAMFLYDAHAQATDDPVVREQLEDIRDEERAHMGELLTLLRYLDPKEADLFLEGQEEVLETLEKQGFPKDTADSITLEKKA